VRGFLEKFEVPSPELRGNLEADAAPLRDGSGVVLDYHHFSLVVSKARRIALYTACNIDGQKSEADKLPRSGPDRWFYDLRIDPKYQIGDELYADNELDRGHLVRREDPVWGEIAKEANSDTFHFTNCSPQHSALNQKLWLGLENYVLQNARAESLRATVFTGPVLRDDDPLYRGVRIPRSFWKVVAIYSEGRPSATAYEISQEKLIRDLEFVYGAYKTYQVSIRHIERATNLDFGPIRKYDGFSNEEAATGADVRVYLPDWPSIRI
jgi:endonuclease G